MLIYIDNTIGEYLADTELTYEQIMLFNDVGQANKRGSCIACGEVKSIDALIAHEDIASGAIKLLRSNGTDLKEICRLVDVVFVITCREKEGARKLPRYIKDKARYLSIEEAGRWVLGNKCSLIGENLRDCAFYAQLGRFFCYANKVKGVSVSFSPENGGGSSTGDTLTSCVKEQNKFALCIVDRDWRYGHTSHGSPESGGTCKAVEKAAQLLDEEHYRDKFHLCPLNVHEAENLIPICVLEKLPEAVCSPKGREAVKMLKEVSSGEPILYYDFKKKLKDKGNEAYFAYWDKIRLELGGKAWEDTYYPVGKRVLSQATNYMKDTGLEWITLDDYLKRAWELLGRILFTWGCVSLPTST